MPAMSVISLKNVFKDYKIYFQRGQKFKEWLTFNRRKYHDVNHALEDISLEVQKGECVGIIGDNGSGKSTILKILAGTSYATEGQVSIEGKVSYILDVSTGFNPDFTGRENVFTKCALLGMTPDEINEMYDAIVDFSGLAERIDHPLRTYSTGMIMRIGFSVAVHVPFEILIVDEVLSVGDYLFQRKCVNAIRSIIEAGKTVIITSHSLSEVSSFCNRLVLIQDGRIIMEGATDKVIQAYIENCEKCYSRIEAPIVEDKVLAVSTERVGNARILKARLKDQTGKVIDTIDTGQTLRVHIIFLIEEPIDNPCIRVQFLRNDGLLAMGTNSYRHDVNYGTMQGHYEVWVDFDNLQLLEGEYYVNIGIWPDEWKSYSAKTPLDVHEYKHVIKVESKRIDGGGLAKANSDFKLKKLPEIT